MIFTDRSDAGRQLAEKLIPFKKSNTLVLAVPRGGVPVGHEIARRLEAPLDIILSKKIGYPGNEEFAIGWVTENDYYLDPRFGHIQEDYILDQITSVRKELHRRHLLYTGQKSVFSAEGKSIILTDDGIATGNTLMACLNALRKENPQEIIVAVPVSPTEQTNRFQSLADHFICLHTTDDFNGVGQFYRHFPQVSDDEVKACLVRE